MKLYCGFNLMLVECSAVLLILFGCGVITDVHPAILCIPIVVGGVNFFFIPFLAALKMSSIIDREETTEYIN